MNPKEDQLSEESTSAKIKWRWSFLLILAILALNILSCQNLLCFLYYCSNEIGDYSANGLDFSASGALVDESKMTVWYAIKASGVFTPTNGSQPGEYVMDGVDHDIPANWEAMFHEVEEKGFMAIRVPHVPPTYTLSSIYSTTVEIQYYSPPTATTATVVTPTLNRRVDLEPMVNEHYPIEDGQSHWEVWWLPQGEKFPVPDAPFRIDDSAWAAHSEFNIDMGDGVNAYNCAGCSLEYTFYNGYVFIGPFKSTMRLWGAPDQVAGNPKIQFDQCHGESEPTIAQIITPTQTITHEHCLMNVDTVTGTYTLQTGSSQNLNYTFYTQANEPGALPVPYTSDPITLSPSDWGSCEDEIRILAVHTSTLGMDTTIREMFAITATSTISPGVQASAFSIAFGPDYVINEGGGYNIYLPLVRR